MPSTNTSPRGHPIWWSTSRYEKIITLKSAAAGDCKGKQDQNPCVLSKDNQHPVTDKEKDTQENCMLEKEREREMRGREKNPWPCINPTSRHPSNPKSKVKPNAVQLSLWAHHTTRKTTLFAGENEETA
eukprot:TRINITY_DN12870_c0_g1_i1.p1 TRINITY_DN12870_c0_g1~~TRINITY_DN12870_c0_g1_i1.p1  ORF type:complete len:144 (+),score=16.98 TRINITY_DN12870_c0_g1_i1:47-433(+)